MAQRVAEQAVFQRLSRDQHRLDVCVADTATGEVKMLIEERLNTYVESKPLRLVNNGAELIFWSERDGWGHFYLYDVATGALKNRITEGEYVADRPSKASTRRLECSISRPAAARRARTRTTRTCTASGSTARGLKLLNPGNASHAVSVTDSAQVLRRQLVARERRAGIGALRHARQQAS